MPPDATPDQATAPDRATGPVVGPPVLPDGVGATRGAPVGEPPAEAPGTDRREPPGPLIRWFPRTALLVYAGIRVATVAVVALADLFTHKSLLYDLDIWDGAWFLRAVRYGYPAHLPMTGGHVAANPVAFFPLLPLLVRLIDLTGLPPGWSALLLSAVTGATAVYGVGRLARHLGGDGAGQRAALLFAVFPGTFAFSLAYSEGIVITCVSLGLLALLARRWWLAGLLGAVATAASPVALAFVASCLWCAGREVVKERRYGALVAPLLAPLGFVAYMAYLERHTGTLAAWRLTERGGWKSYPSLVYAVHTVVVFVRDPVATNKTDDLLFVCTALVVVAAVTAVRSSMPTPLLLYGLSAAAFGMISAPIGLRPRFIFLAFPLIIAVGTRLRGRAFVSVAAVSTVFLIGLTAFEVTSWRIFP